MRVYACSFCTDHRQLYNEFSANPPTANNLKKKILKASNCLQILQRLGFNKNMLFDQPIHSNLARFAKYLDKPPYQN